MTSSGSRSKSVPLGTHHRPQRHLRRHFIEDQSLRRRACQARRVVHRRPARRALCAAEDEDLVPEGLAAQFVPRLGDDTLDRVDAAPSRMVSRVTSASPADHFATAKDNRFHGRSPFHRLLTRLARAPVEHGFFRFCELHPPAFPLPRDPLSTFAHPRRSAPPPTR